MSQRSQIDATSAVSFVETDLNPASHASPIFLATIGNWNNGSDGLSPKQT
jgi:hypothetical protein